MRYIISGITLLFTIGICATLIAPVYVSEANAAIKCDGPYQIIKGQGRISTPYCEDGYLARVARAYGMRVSAHAVRQNPFKKQEACRVAGHDIRVADICSGYRFESGGRR